MILAVIPARAGSVRIPDKNLQQIGGLTLVEHAIRHAVDTRYFDAIAVTSDSEAILQMARDNRCIPVCRPAELSRGDQPMQLSVVAHARKEIEPLKFDAVCLLQPTSPFRTPGDIISALKMFVALKADSVVSITDASDDTAYWLGSDLRLAPISEAKVCNGAVYIAKTSVLDAGGHWFSGRMFGYYMPRIRSIDIDTMPQLDEARARYARKDFA